MAGSGLRRKRAGYGQLSVVVRQAGRRLIDARGRVGRAAMLGVAVSTVASVGAISGSTAALHAHSVHVVADPAIPGTTGWSSTPGSPNG